MTAAATDAALAARPPAPAGRLPGVHRWLAGLGLAAVLCALIAFGFEPGSFLVIAPLLVLALLLLFVFGTATLLDPPGWAGPGLIVVGYCIMDFSLRKGGVTAGGFDAQSVAKGLVWILVLLYGAVHGWRGLGRTPAVALLALYGIGAFLSALYSPARTLGLGSGIALLAVAMYGGVIAQWDAARLHRLWHALFVAIALLAVASLAAYFALPTWARDYQVAGAGRLRGVTGSGNSLGPIMSVGVLVGLYTLAGARAPWTVIWRGVLVGVMLACLVLSDSRGAIAGLIAALLALAAAGNVVVGMIALVGAVVAAWALLQPALLADLMQGLAAQVARSGDVRELTTMTGRSEIWAAVVPKWLAHPLFGYGLASPRIVVSEAYQGAWGQTYESAHNWLLESLVSFGLAGTAVLVLLLALIGIAAWRQLRRLRALRRRDPQPRIAADAALMRCVLGCWVFLLVAGLVEKAFAGMPSPDTVLLAFLAGSCAVLGRGAAPPAGSPGAAPIRPPRAFA